MITLWIDFEANTSIFLPNRLRQWSQLDLKQMPRNEILKTEFAGLKQFVNYYIGNLPSNSQERFYLKSYNIEQNQMTLSVLDLLK